MTLTFTYANSTTPIAGVKVIMTESDGAVTVLVTDANGQITLPSTSNTYTLSASLAETGEDPISIMDAIHILQYGGELRTLTDDQKTAADVNADGEVDILDAIWILQHLGELRTLDSSLIFLDANTGNPLSQTTFRPGDTPNISVIRKGDVDGDFDPSLITDHAPILTGKTTLVMDENETTVSTLVGVDADNDALTYSITGGADKDLFTIDGSTGALTFKTGPDYEAPGDSGGNNLYDLEITVSDGSNETVQALVVSVNDLNEKIAMTKKLINENTAGATVGDLSILDTAFGNENITYALSGDDAEYFVLEGTTIKLKSDVTVDYETRNSYTLTVTATNTSGDSVTEQVTLKVNAAPTDISISNDSIVENAYGHIVSNLTVTDVNKSETFNYVLSGEDADYFYVTDAGVLKLSSVFSDYEHKNTLNVTVKAIDQGGLSIEKSFTINVTNVDYATPYAPDLWSWPWIVASNDSEINALLMEKWPFNGFYISFDPDNDPSTPLVMTYSVITTLSTISQWYYDDVSNFIVNGSDEWEDMVDQAFAYWGIVSGITFVKIEETATQVGDIRIGLTSGDLEGAGGWSHADRGTYNKNGFDPWGSDMSKSQDIWIDADIDPITGSRYGPSILIHEIGHSLGLSHPFEDTFISSKENNTNLYTVMAYAGDSYVLNSWDIDGDGINEWEYGNWLYATKPSINDIKAIQYIYGMTPDYNQGDTVYVYVGPIYETIYDTGGVDTIDLSNYILDTHLDLRDGNVSYIGTDELKISEPIAAGSSDYSYGYSGFPISIAFGTIIENAITGNGNDYIICNNAINTITCNLGSDLVLFIGSGDTVYGGGGNDIFYSISYDFSLIDGGDGTDIFKVNFLGSNIDLSNFLDSSFASIETLNVSNGIPTLITLTEQSILNFNSATTDDIDEDGDVDYYFFISGDSGKDTVLLNQQEWTFYKTLTLSSGFTYDFFTSDGGDTYFATTNGIGVYDSFLDNASTTIDKQTVEENLANASVGLLSATEVNQLSPSSSIIFILSGDDAEFFELDDNGVLRIKSGTIVDYEAKTAFNVTVNLGYYVGSEFTTLSSKNYEITVINGEENDIIGQLVGHTTSEIIEGTPADDSIDYGGGDDRIDGKDGNDTLVYDNNHTTAFEILTIAGITAIRVGSSASTHYTYDDVRLINVESIKFNDTYLALNTTLATESIFWGSHGNDSLNGTDGDDIFDGAGGDDRFDGGGGNDTLVIFSYKDFFELQTVGGITKIYGATYVDFDDFSTAYWYYDDKSKMARIETIEFIDGSLSLDTALAAESIIWGTTASEDLAGTNVDDLFDSAGGNDRINGKAGNDTLSIFSDKANFEIMTVAGLTKIYGDTNVSGLGSAYYGDIIKTFYVESIAFTDQTVTLDTAFPFSGGTIYWYLTSASQTTTGSDDIDMFDSAGGNDTINGKAGNDTLAIFSNKENFEVVTLAGLTKIYGETYVSGLGSAYVFYTIRMNNVENIAFADQSINVETASIGGNYIFWGSTSGTTIDGTDGDDVIDSGGGSDYVRGGVGNDTLLLFADRADFDIVTLSGLTKIYGLESSGLAGNYVFDTIRMSYVETVMFADQTISVETSHEGNWIAWGSTSGTTIDGTDGDDVIDSGGGSDYVRGGVGNDTLLLFADRADFDIVTLSGLTKIYGLESSGLAGNYVFDTIRMYSVEKIMFADQEISVATGGITGTDTYYFWGKTYGQTYSTGDGNDVIDSGGGNDTIDGGTGDDTLLLFADKSTFDITVNGDTVTLVGNSSVGLASVYLWDTITMTNVETIMFADQTVTVSELTSSSTSNPLVGVGKEVSITDNIDDNSIITIDDPINDYQLDHKLWATEFDINSITLPETVMDETASESFDLTDLSGLLGSQTDSLALNFESFSDDTGIAIEAVKPIDLNTFNPVLDHYQDSWLEDLVYSSELG